jgi:hypothetical protein
MSIFGLPAVSGSINPVDTTTTQGSFMDRFWGGKDSPGYLNTGVAAVSGLGNAWLGMKQYSLAKKMFKEQSAYAAADLANQAKTTNERLATRQERRINEGTATGTVSDFMSKYGVQGKVG